MNFWQSVLLGAVQGLTEFLPVSSSGHLLLVQDLIGVNVESNLLLSLLLHFGTLIAVCIVLFDYIIDTFKNPKKLLLWVVASIPAGIVGFTLSDVIDQYLYNLDVLPFTFLATAILLVVCEIVAKKTKENKQLSTKMALLMGLGQALAVLPGLSRSGTTVAFGVFAKGDKEEIAKFSFLMSIPVIFGSLLLEVVKFVANPTPSLGGTPWYNVAVAVIVAGLTGIVAINLLIKLIKTSNFKWFSVYLTALAVVLFIFK